MPAPVRYEFGPFTLDPASFRLGRGRLDVPLTPKAFELLSLLVRERHRVLTKQELLDAVWPDTAVVEDTLTQRIKEIREALGDRAQEPTYIRTLPRIGFQFVGDVAETAAPPPVATGRVAPDDAPQPGLPQSVAPTPLEAPVDSVEQRVRPIVARVWKGPWLATGLLTFIAAVTLLV
jgi:DNA-binding winged helix-turn-helix (wHTH) protein